MAAGRWYGPPLRLTCADPGIASIEGKGFQMKMFELEDVVSLLREEVQRAGSQGAFAKKNGIHRTALNKVLNGARMPPSSIIDVLGLAPIYVFKTDLPRRGRRRPAAAKNL